ncbi:peroxisomal fatty acid beta-oxidation multifunctional protein AIM1-like [Chenopodium quinoa]|uniref:peroxisomal fatty acid beta-oxidation multifunctional protein AIM1-like n=1 Tax=Chenopodium quinoa TaxID=63459 RepID=UPI000B774B76|nr:peroxisomal fatty acid beta-oxidation multifunctional protein AIM1-like [Chenopodium quinoa]
MTGCHARISSTKVQLVMPELLFGLIPGLGGTQRLPRLIGLIKAIELIFLSKPIASEEGVELGLIDAVVPSEELLKVSQMWALDIAEGRKPLVRCLHMTDKLGSLTEVREILMVARQKATQHIARNMPQYQACLDVIEEGIIHGGYAGILKEEKVFKELLLSETSKGLLHIFLAQNLTSKISGVRDAGLKPRRMKKVAVIGGGLMGSSIATALLLSNIHVVLNESNAEFLAKGIQSIQGNIRDLVTKGKLINEKAKKALSLLKGELDYTEFRDVDMVIEVSCLKLFTFTRLIVL